MRKFLLCTLLFSAVGFASAQVTFGLRVAPQLAFTRVGDEVDGITFDKDGSGLRFAIGPMLEFQIVDKVGFYTGVWFATKRSGITYEDELSIVVGSATYNLAYVQLPVGIKFYTGDLIKDRFRLYFDFGGTFDFKTGEKLKESTNAFIDSDDKFAKAIDAMASFGFGTEFDLGLQNKLFFGLRYSRGLLNIVQKDFTDEDGLTIKNDNVALEVGIKF